MSNATIIAITLVVFFALMLTQHYISTVMFGSAIVGLFIIGGWNFSYISGAFINEPMQNAASYTMTTIPLYVLMAQFILEAGLIRDLYAIVYKLSKGKKGSLGVLTQVMGGFLGAVCGSGTATSAALGQISIPELRARGYTEGLAGAVAATAGSLSAVVPPAIMMIVYGSCAQVSIGSIFMGAMIPGILCVVCFSVITIGYLHTKKEKELMAKEQIVECELEISRGQAIFAIVACGVLITAVFGGIYSGMFTPTEAGGIGAFLALVFAMVRNCVSVKMIKKSMLEAVKTTGMATCIMMAASIFGKFVSRSMLPRYLVQSMAPLIEKPLLLELLLLVFYFILFMFLDGTATVLMTVPILLPILNAANIDLIWFGVFVCVLTSMGGLTPPVGMNVYATSGSSGLSMTKIFRYTFVYSLISCVIVCGALICFPALATWLPSTM